jgi:DNA-binding helix-hairpin-helix protein with protein kinase domain
VKEKTMKVTFADGSTEEYDDKELESGKGKEGLIYRSLEGDSDFAIKLYNYDPQKDAERIDRIDKLIHCREFNPTIDNHYWAQYFAWPEKRVVEPRVGFRMRRVKGLKTLGHYIGDKNAQIKPQERGWHIGRIATAIKLVTAANKLESMGICYPDFSPNNVLVNPFTGQMALVDCDSLVVHGSLLRTIEGTRLYLAPELLKGIEITPTVEIEADRYALAVILYSWFLLCHPLEGDKVYDRTDEQYEYLRYGEHALYIEDPGDTSNHKSQQELKASMLGTKLEELFHQAFVKGLHHPDNRPSPSQWQKALFDTYDRLIPCASPYCDWRFFVVDNPSQLQCPRCKQWLREPEKVPFVYLFSHGSSYNQYKNLANEKNRCYVIGWPGRHLHHWHVQLNDHIFEDPLYIPDSTPCAMFKYEKATKQWFLQNLTLPNMKYHNPLDPLDTWIDRPVKSSVPLVTGIILQFGKAAPYGHARVVLEGVR